MSSFPEKLQIGLFSTGLFISALAGYNFVESHLPKSADVSPIISPSSTPGVELTSTLTPTLSRIPTSSATVLPAPYLERSPIIWIRNDYSTYNNVDLMNIASQLGVGGVRIDIGAGDFIGGGGVDTSLAIKRAQELNFGLELCYNPKKLIPLDRLQSEVSKIVQHVSPKTRLLVDASNEVDNKAVPFWPGSLDTYPVFAAMLQKEITRQRPGTEVVMSATVNPLNERHLVQGLLDLGVNPEEFLWALHIYGGAKDVKLRTQVLESVFSDLKLKRPKIIYDETGIDSLFMESVHEELKYDPVLIVGHELTYKPWKQEHYGLISLRNLAPNKYFDPVKKLIYEVSQPKG